MKFDEENLRLVRLYEKFSSPDFVRKYGSLSREDGYEMFTTKTVITTKLLGEITLGTAYFPPLSHAVPVIFLTDRQVKILHDNKIRLLIKKRKHSTGFETYLGFPSKSSFERIIAS